MGFIGKFIGICVLLAPVTSGVSLIVMVIGFLFYVWFKSQAAKDRAKNSENLKPFPRNALEAHILHRRELDEIKNKNSEIKKVKNRSSVATRKISDNKLGENKSHVTQKSQNCFALDALRSHRIDSIWYISHVENLASILEHGILSNSKSREIITNSTDISDPGAQRWRDRKESVYSRSIHDYTPLYLNVRNPMLYVKRKINSSLCLIEVSVEIINTRKCVISDGNAASRETKFYAKDNQDLNIFWDVLSAEYWSNFPDGKRKRCAEVLVYPCVDKQFIRRIHFHSYDTLQRFRSNDVECCLSPRIFFN